MAERRHAPKIAKRPRDHRFGFFRTLHQRSTDGAPRQTTNRRTNERTNEREYQHTGTTTNRHASDGINMVSMTRKRIRMGRRRGSIFPLSLIRDSTGVVLAGLLTVFVFTCCLIAVIIQKTTSYYSADHRDYFGRDTNAAVSLADTDEQQQTSENEFDNWLSKEKHRQPKPNPYIGLFRTPTYPREDSLRYSFDLAHGVDMDRTIAAVQKERVLGDSIAPVSAADMTYDIFNCPPTPPAGYPHAWNIVDVLTHWNPDDTNVPHRIHQGLCWFDWTDTDQRGTAETYRKAELPFLVRNHPDLWQTAERWSSRKYMMKLVDPEKKYKTEHSKNNHMMFWRLRKGARPQDWKEPTDITQLSYQEWYDKALEMEYYNPANGTDKPMVAKEHWYFRLNAALNSPTDFVYDELTMFVPDKSKFFMVDPSDQRGINCRFGMKGIIAENHYDFSRNFIFILKGRKRYILAHPNQCKNMMLYPNGHPSARHSSVNWSNPNDWDKGSFSQAKVNEVVMQAGDALYLPTAWFHFIVSLNLNYQCNARSGITMENKNVIKECGF